jgi:predicted phage terminase large subunit-like protein
MDLWREWKEILHDHYDPLKEVRAEEFFNAHQAEMEDEACLPLWPAKEPLYALMSLWASVGDAAFRSEKMNDPSDPSASEWPSEYFDRKTIWFEEWPSDLTVRTIFLDPSKGADAKHGDYSAIVLYGRDKWGVEYVEADLERRGVDKMCSDLLTHARRFVPDRIGLEANGFQDLLAAPLREAAKKEGMDLPLILVTNSVNKAVRIRRLTSPLSQGKLRFKRRSPGTQLLLDQLRDFPNSKHDDGPDAAEGARRVAIELVNGGKK